MKLRVVWVAAKSRSKEPAYDQLTNEYGSRIARFQQIELKPAPSEDAILNFVEKESQRTRPVLVLLDSRGRELSSQQFAAWFETQQQNDVQQLIFAIGPADGFSAAAQQRADAIISLGKMTLAHELARVVLLEQIYRAFTIIRKHPYHCGH